MKARIRNLIVVASLTLMALAVPLRACCDDFWSCAAAVATGGLSCAIENLVNSVRSMIQNVQNLVNTLAQQAADIVNLARTELGGAANDLRNLASQAEGDFNAAFNLGQSIVDAETKKMQAIKNVASGAQFSTATTTAAGRAALPPGTLAPPPAGGTASKAAPGGGKALPPGPGISTPGGAGPGGAGGTLVVTLPADSTDIQDALKRAQAALGALRPEVANPLNSVRQFANQAEQQALAAASSAGHIAESVLLAPLRTLGTVLQDLVSHPERIFDPSRIVDDAITSVNDQVINTMNQVHEAVMSQAKGTLDLARKPIQDALHRAAVSKKVADAMDKLHKQRTKGSLEALNGLIPHANLPSSQLVVHMAAFTHASGLQAVDLGAHDAKVAVPFNRVAASKLTARTIGIQLGGRIKKPWQDFKRLQAAPVKPIPEAQPRVDAEIQRRFAGKTPAQAEAEKRAMLSEARSRFANDPKTLQKVSELIEGHPVIVSRISPGSGPRSLQP